MQLAGREFQRGDVLRGIAVHRIVSVFQRRSYSQRPFYPICIIV
jgi:hypothetical protein